MQNQDITLADLGWSSFFQDQLTNEDAGLVPVRVAGVHRRAVDIVGQAGAGRMYLPTETVGVGDWVLTDAAGAPARVLARHSLLQRRAAGDAPQAQILAANVDTMLIVTSCNPDFNPARLERYLALARQAEVHPVIVLTKSDMCENASEYLSKANKLGDNLDVLAMDATSPDAITQLARWCGAGKTIVLLGSSGVGKSTLANGLTGSTQETRGIREDDARGRHTTTARSMHPMTTGGWLIDTPGMRSLALFEAAEGVHHVFADIAELATECRFSNCSHEHEPGCAVQAAVQAGQFDAARVRRWIKLRSEDAMNTETIAERHKRARSTTKMHRVHKSAKKFRRGEPD